MNTSNKLDYYSNGYAERQAQIESVERKIQELGIKYIYFQLVSITGRVVGKGVPAAHWRRLANAGIQMVYGSTVNVATSRTGQYLGYGPAASELVALPDPDTFVQLPWDKRLARVFCTLFHNREHEEHPGQFLDADCRGNLRRAHEKFQQDHNGLHLRVGVEPEMMWLKQDSNGQPAGGASKPYCYHIDQFESLRPVYMKVLDYCEAMGLDMVQGDHEDAPGQLELNFMFDDPLRTADRLTTYRQICAQVAREHNLIACFMAKPFMNVSGSGCHHNVSLWKGGDDVVLKAPHYAGSQEVFSYRQGGENLFMPRPGSQKPGPVGLQCIGGVINHLNALTAIGSSTVNSYRRLWDMGYWAPVYADWGYQNRTCGLRVSAPGRFEYRSVDAMVNPYLMSAALLAAFDDGIQRNLDPGEPETRSVYDAIDAGKKVSKLPMTLGDALDALAADDVIRAALPGKLYDIYSEFKRDEWERFLSTVTQWDIDRYMDFIP